MGGITTSACLTVYDWIDAAAICMGVTSVTKLAQAQLEQFKAAGVSFEMSEAEQRTLNTVLAQFDLENKATILNEVPVIFWHGMKDPIVPFQLSYPFYERQKDKGYATKSEFIVDKNAAHAVSRAGILQVTSWLADNLA